MLYLLSVGYFKAWRHFAEIAQKQIQQPPFTDNNSNSKINFTFFIKL